MSRLARVIFNPDTTPPSVPVNVTATPISQSGIHLVWSASSDTGGSGLAGYRIYRSAASSGPFTLLGTASTASYDDSGLQGSATWFYRVTAYDAAGNESAQSLTVSATTPDQTAPSVPAGLAASVVSSSQINLTWNASTDTGGSGLAGYKVYRNGAPIATPTATAFSDTGLTPSTAYTYQVSAVDNAGNGSALSSQAGATTQVSITWATVPTIQFVQGTASNAGVASYVTDSLGLPMTITKNVAALPAGVTFNVTAQRYEYDGVGGVASTSGHILTADDGSGALIASDWARRKAEGRILLAVDFSDLVNDFDQTKHVFGADDAGQGGPGSAYWKSLITQFTGDSRLPFALKILSPASTGANGAAWFTGLNPGGFPGSATLGGAWTLESQGLAGRKFYFQVRFKPPASRFIRRNSAGYKYFDLSAYSVVDPPNRSYSNTNFEIIGQVEYPQASNGFMCAPLSYHRTTDGSFPLFYNAGDPATGGFFVSRQDNGAGISDDLLRFCEYLNGSLSAGCFQFAPDTWTTIDAVVNIQTLGGTAGNTFELYATPQDGTTRTQLLNESNVDFGSDPRFTGGTCGGWLNAYETSWAFTSGDVDTYQMWSQYRVGLDPLSLPVVGA